MKKIKIIQGGYGYRPDADGAVQLVTKKDNPIEVEDAEAERLIKANVAKMYEEAEDSVDLTSYGISKLRKMAKEMGLSGKGTKEELIEAINSAEGESTDEETESDDVDENQESDDEDDSKQTDDEEPPFLTPADPEV